MSFHGLAETSDRSACVTSDPSGSRRSSRRCAESTTSSRPSGRKSMHIGNDGTVAITWWLPSAPSAITWFAPQSENQSRPSCQRGDSPNTPPSIRTSAAPILSLLLADGLVRQTAPGSGTHRTSPAPSRLPPASAPPLPPWPTPAEHLARLEAGQLHRPTGHPPLLLRSWKFPNLRPPTRRFFSRRGGIFALAPGRPRPSWTTP